MFFIIVSFRGVFVFMDFFILIDKWNSTHLLCAYFKMCVYVKVLTKLSSVCFVHHTYFLMVGILKIYSNQCLIAMSLLTIVTRVVYSGPFEIIPHD